MEKTIVYLEKMDSGFTQILNNEMKTDEDYLSRFQIGVTTLAQKYHQNSFDLFTASGKIELIDPEVSGEIQQLYEGYKDWSEFFELHKDKAHNIIRPLVLKLGFDERNLRTIKAEYGKITGPAIDRVRLIMNDPRFKRGMMHQKIMCINIKKSYIKGIEEIDMIIERIRKKLNQ